MCEKAKRAELKPRWVVVPDVVADPVATLSRWIEWAPRLKSFGWPMAFAVQDGHTRADIPKNADIVFVGGTTEWKRKMIYHFASNFPRVHVGRINTERWLFHCLDCGVESCDGTGFFRGDQKQLAGLERVLKVMSGKLQSQSVLNFEPRADGPFSELD